MNDVNNAVLYPIMGFKPGSDYSREEREDHKLLIRHWHQTIVILIQAHLPHYSKTGESTTQMKSTFRFYNMKIEKRRIFCFEFQLFLSKTEES
jgi:hypothetical protein